MLNRENITIKIKKIRRFDEFRNRNLQIIITINKILTFLNLRDVNYFSKILIFILFKPFNYIKFR